MSDLATALQTAINKKLNQGKQMQTVPNELKSTIDDWAKDDVSDEPKSVHLFKPTTNVSRETFNAVRDNPRLQQKDIVRLMVNRGFNQSSIGSLLMQMIRNNMVTRDDNGRYTALQAEYSPIKPPKRNKVKRLKVAMPVVKKPTAGIAALGTQDRVPAPAMVVPSFNPEELLSTLSFAQVMTLYKRIKTLVGEA